MSPRSALSTAARRTLPSPISELMTRALAAPDVISLAAGFVDPATLPTGLVAAKIQQMLACEKEGPRALQYGTTAGDLKLREQLVAFLERSEGFEPGACVALHRVVVTNGSQQLLYLLTEALIDPGDIVLVESPTYFVYLGVLQSFGAKVIGVETDAGGLRVDALEKALAEIEAAGELGRVKLVYTVSEHSNPTGLCLAADRREALVRTVKAWSKPHPIYILEDAAYRGLTFDGVEPPSVWRHDPGGQTVILARTFSKTFSPGLRLGYGVLPDALVDPVLNLKGNHDFGSNHFVQQLLAGVLSDGQYERQMERCAAAYRRKRDVMLEALDEHLGPFGVDVSWTRPRGGLYVWLAVPEDVDASREGALFENCLEAGVLYVPGDYAYPELPAPAPRNHARLSFGVPTEEGLREGAKRLALALRKTLHAQSRSNSPAGREASATAAR